MQVWYNGYYESLPRIRWGFDYPYLLQCGVVDTLNNPPGGLKPCMDAMRTLRKRQTRGEAIIRRRQVISGWETRVGKAGVLQSDTNRMSSLANGILRDLARIKPRRVRSGVSYRV